MVEINSTEAFNDFKDYLTIDKPKKIEFDRDKRTIKTEHHTVSITKEFESLFDIIDVPKSAYDNDLIFGKDKTEGIVGVDFIGEDVVLFLNDGTTKTVPRTYWVMTPHQVFDESEKLEGKLHYNYITEYTDPEDFKVARQALYRKRADMYIAWNPIESAMIYNGFTMFKGLKVEDVSVLSFDIEANGLVHNEASKVFMISNSFRKDGKVIKKCFTVDEYEDNDCDMIEAWCKWVQEVDPTIVIGHNVFSYDFPYLSYCYGARDGLKRDLPLGKDCSDITYNKKPSKFRKDGSQEYDYHNANIFGREIIDTFFLSIKYDFKRAYPSYGLKSIIETEGLVKNDRVFYDASKIGKNWHIPAERKKIIEYGKDDADDSLALYDLMIPSFFYYTQSIPKSFQAINNSATGSQINSFLVRSYIQDRHSIPKATDTEHFEGGISFGNPGIYSHVLKVDVASLYPSIMRQYKVYDKVKDPKAKFLEMVDYFTIERLNNKRLGNETGDRYYKDMEQSQKIVINSAYGLLGAPGLNFNSIKNAAFVTGKGREILQKGIDWAEKLDYSIVNVDTDSFSYTSGKKRSQDEFDAEIADLNTYYPDGIIWEDDGMYKNFVVVKAKNYVYQGYKKKDKVKTKGSALKASMKEIALKEFLNECLLALLAKRKDKLFSIYNKYALEIKSDIDITRWSSKKTITKAVLNPERTTEQKILDAIEGVKVQEGDKIRVYFDLDENLKLEERYENDHHIGRLLGKLYNTLEIFSTLIDMDCYPNYKLKRNEDILLDI